MSYNPAPNNTGQLQPPPGVNPDMQPPPGVQPPPTAYPPQQAAYEAPGAYTPQQYGASAPPPAYPSAGLYTGTGATTAQTPAIGGQVYSASVSNSGVQFGSNKVHPQAPGGPVIVGQPIMSKKLGADPVMVYCPNSTCDKTVMTNTSKKCGPIQYIGSGGICCIGLLFAGICWCGCCLIPFCIPSLYDHEHRCPECGRILGYQKYLD